MFRGLLYGSYKAPRELCVDFWYGHLPGANGRSFYGLRTAMGANVPIGAHR